MEEWKYQNKTTLKKTQPFKYNNTLIPLYKEENDKDIVKISTSLMRFF